MSDQKYIEKKFGRYKFPQLVVFKEKHDNRYFLVTSLEDVLKMSLKVVKERGSGRYAWYDTNPETPTYEQDVTDEVLATLPEALKKEALAVRARNLRALRDYEEDLKFAGLVKKALDGDGYAAYMVIEMHQDYEYEGFKFEDLETV